MPVSTPAVPETASTSRLSFGRWIGLTFGMLALFAAGDLLLAWTLDPYGVLRNPMGRSLSVVKHDRQAKLLFNERYVPTNFDALILGDSASLNWDAHLLTGYRFYNESVLSGDGTEERMLVEPALRRRHFRVALVALHPAITASHTVQDGLDKASVLQAFGSLNSLQDDAYLLRAKLTHHASGTYRDGSADLPPATKPVPDLYDGRFTTVDTTLDPKGLADYRAIVQQLQSSGTRVVYVIYPSYGPFLELHRAALEDYFGRIPGLLPTAPIIDFNTPEYASFRNDPKNYTDVIHLSQNGAQTISRLLNGRMHAALGDQPAIP